MESKPDVYTNCMCTQKCSKSDGKSRMESKPDVYTNCTGVLHLGEPPT